MVARSAGQVRGRFNWLDNGVRVAHHTGIEFDNAHGLGVVFHQHHLCGAPGGGLEPKRAGAGKEVEHVHVHEAETDLQGGEQSLPRAVRSGARALWRHLDFSAAGLAGNDAVHGHNSNALAFVQILKVFCREVRRGGSGEFEVVRHQARGVVVGATDQLKVLHQV